MSVHHLTPLSEEARARLRAEDRRHALALLAALDLPDDLKQLVARRVADERHACEYQRIKKRYGK